MQVAYAYIKLLQSCDLWLFPNRRKLRKLRSVETSLPLISFAEETCLVPVAYPLPYQCFLGQKTCRLKLAFPRR